MERVLVRELERGYSDAIALLWTRERQVTTVGAR